MDGDSTMPDKEPFTTYTEVKPEWIDFNDEQMTRFQQELDRGQQFPLPEGFGRKLGIRR